MSLPAMTSCIVEKNGLDELLLLVVEVLADALGDRDRRALQLQHAERDAVDVEDDVRPLVVCSPRTVTSSAMAKSLFSGFSQSISQTVSFCSPDVGLDLHAVAQQVVDVAVGVVERLAAARRQPALSSSKSAF